ncbi:MAG: MCP four helix bundle domain-containing protein [Acidobacteria bacterium]|nr:MCP four helix bundle domain-containing protein [Acidobacteriota bacterium]
MKLRMKIMSGFLILVIMLAIAGIFSIYELMSMSSSVQSLLDDNYKSIIAGKKMVEALERQDSGLLLWISGEREEGRKMMEKADAEFQSALSVAKNNLTLPNEADFVEDIESRYRTYGALQAVPLQNPSGNFDMAWYFSHGHPAFQAAKTSVDVLTALNDEAMYRTASNLKNRMRRITMPGIVAIVSALVFAFLFNYFIHRYFVNPIISITHEVQNYLKTGRPTGVEVETDDELKDLASAIQDLSHLVRKQ